MSRRFYGTELTHDECWDLWESEQRFWNVYHLDEAGFSDEEQRAFSDPFIGYAAAEACLYQSRRAWLVQHPTAVNTAGFFDRDIGHECMLIQQEQNIDPEYKARLEDDRRYLESILPDEFEQLVEMTLKPIY